MGQRLLGFTLFSHLSFVLGMNLGCLGLLAAARGHNLQSRFGKTGFGKTVKQAQQDWQFIRRT
jgi:hypothetical protein